MKINLLSYIQLNYRCDYLISCSKFAIRKYVELSAADKRRVISRVVLIERVSSLSLPRENFNWISQEAIISSSPKS